MQRLFWCRICWLTTFRVYLNTFCVKCGDWSTSTASSLALDVLNNRCQMNNRCFAADCFSDIDDCYIGVCLVLSVSLTWILSWVASLWSPRWGRSRDVNSDLTQWLWCIHCIPRNLSTFLFWDNANNQKYIYILFVLLKMTFLDFPR